MARGAGASGWGGGSGGGGAKGRREKYSEFGNINVGGGYKTSQETIDIARKTIETNVKAKNVPDWAVFDYIQRTFSSNPSQKEGEWAIRSMFDEKRWKKTRKGAKDFPQTRKEQRKAAVSGKGRTEREVTSSTYERSVKRKQKQFDKWFGRGMS